MERKNKRRIRRVAAASLVLGGGCGGDGGVSPAKLASDLCTALEACFPSEFPIYYTSQEECGTAILTQFEAFETSLLGANADTAKECKKALRTYYECYVETIAATCDYAQVDTACSVQLQAANTACPNNP